MSAMMTCLREVIQQCVLAVGSVVRILPRGELIAELGVPEWDGSCAPALCDQSRGILDWEVAAAVDLPVNGAPTIRIIFPMPPSDGREPGMFI